MTAKTPEFSFVFLLCSERSGGTLLTRIFNSHSQVCGPVPSDIGRYVLGNLHRYMLSDEEEKCQLAKDLIELFRVKIGEWKRDPTLSEVLANIRSHSLLDVYLDLYQKEADAHGKPVAFIKETRVYDWAALLGPALNRTRFIYMIRDPRDMALSWQKAPALRGGVPRASTIWTEDQEGYSRLVAQLEALTGQSIPVITYEELLVDPTRSLARACSAIGLDYEPAMLQFHNEPNNLAHASMVAEWKNTGRSLIPNNAGKFASELETEEIRFIESACADGMTALGYVPVEPPLSKPESDSLSRTLRSREPWEKSAYLKLSDVERSRRERQHEVMQRICSRPWKVKPR